MFASATRIGVLLVCKPCGVWWEEFEKLKKMKKALLERMFV